MKDIGHCNWNGKIIELTRDQWGKFYITVDGKTTQRKLNAEEMGRYFLNTLHTEQIDLSIMDDNTLRIESNKFLMRAKRIEAIKFVREHRNWGLREALDYLQTSENY